MAFFRHSKKEPTGVVFPFNPLTQFRKRTFGENFRLFAQRDFTVEKPKKQKNFPTFSLIKKGFYYSKKFWCFFYFCLGKTNPYMKKVFNFHGRFFPNFINLI